MTISIHIDQDQDRFHPGEQISGAVEWQCDKEPREITVNLLWSTEGKGTQDVEVVDSQTISVFGNSGREEFSFELPLGPYSYSGRMLSINWAVEAVPKKGKEFAQFPFELRV